MVETKMKFRYKESPGYRAVTATGVFGGPIISGDLMCNFFIEHHAAPEEGEVYIDLSSGKPVGKIVYPEGQRILVRELQVGIIMNPRIAKAVGEWLIKRAEELMKIQSSPAS